MDDTVSQSDLDVAKEIILERKRQEEIREGLENEDPFTKIAKEIDPNFTKEFEKQERYKPAPQVGQEEELIEKLDKENPEEEVDPQRHYI